MPKRPQKKPNQPEQPVPPDHPDAKPEPGDIGLQAIATLDKHKKTVIIGTLAAALAICVGLVARQIGDQKRTVAAEAYSQAASERSIEKLDAVVSDHPGSAAAGNALLTKSEIQLSMEKTEDAKISLLTFVDKFKKHPRYVQGLFALGNLHQNSGDPTQAADFYTQALAAGPDSDIAPLIVIRQGDLALEDADRLLKEGKTEEAKTRKDEARTYYEDSVRRINFRANRFIPMAEEKINLLALGDVPVVPAPPPPPPAPEPEKPKLVKPEAGSGTVLKPGGAKAPAPPKPEGKKPADAPKPKGDAPKKPADAPKPPADAPKKPDAPADAPKPPADKPKLDTDSPKKADAPKTTETEKPAAPKSAPAEKPEAEATKPEAPAPKADSTPAPAPKPE